VVIGGGTVSIKGKIISNEVGILETDPEDFIEINWENGACGRQGQYFLESGFICDPVIEFQTVEYVYADDEDVVFVFPPVDHDEAIVVWNIPALGEDWIDIVSTGGEAIVVPIIGDPFDFVTVDFTVFLEDEVLLSGSEIVFDFFGEGCETGVIEFVQQFQADEPIMTVTHVTSEGDVYSSFGDCIGLVFQVDGKFIDIVNIEDFEMDQNGLETLKFTLNGDLDLFHFDEFGNLDISNMVFEDLTIAFPHSD
ncbi:MAG: hypothetical protein AAF193_07245, partial [Bacteroidota bacterium]